MSGYIFTLGYFGFVTSVVIISNYFNKDNKFDSQYLKDAITIPPHY